MSRLDPALSRNAGLAAGALLASSATLVCCVLPAVLVAARQVADDAQQRAGRE